MSKKEGLKLKWNNYVNKAKKTSKKWFVKTLSAALLETVQMHTVLYVIHHLVQKLIDKLKLY